MSQGPQTKAAAPRRSAWRTVASVLFWLVTLLVLTVSAGLYTQPGRDALGGVILNQVNALIPGRITIDALTRLDPSGLRAEGVRAFTPDGEEVLTVEVVRVRLQLAQLLEKHIEVPVVRLRAPEVDLGQGDAHSGLLAAFVDPNAEPSPPTDDSGLGLSWAVGRAHLERGRIRLQSGAGQQLEVGNLVLTGQAQMAQDGHLTAKLRELKGRVSTVAGETICHDFNIKGTFNDQGSSWVQGHAEAGDAELDLQAQLDLAPKDWLRRSLSLRLTAEHLSRQLALNFLAPDAIPENTPELALHIGAVGTLGHLQANVLAEAGDSRVTSTLTSDDEGFVWQTRLQAVRVQALVPEFPADDLDLTFKASTPVPKPNQQVWPVELTIFAGRLGEHALPRVRAEANISESGLNDLRLDLRGALLHGWLRGEVEFSGPLSLDTRLTLPDLSAVPAELLPDAQGDIQVSAQLRTTSPGLDTLRANAKVTSAELQLAGLQVERLQLSSQVRGPIDAPRIKGELGVGAVTYDRLQLLDAKAQLAGPLTRLKLRLNSDLRWAAPADQPTVPPGQGSFVLQSTVQQADDVLRLDGDLDGRFNDYPLQLHIVQAEQGPDGFHLTELSLHALDHALHVHDVSVTPERLRGELELPPVELQTICKLLQLDPPIAGQVAASGRVQGTLDAPQLALDIQAQELQRNGSPEIQARLLAELNKPDAEGNQPLKLSAQVSRLGHQLLQSSIEGQVPVGPLPENLKQGRYTASARVQLESQTVQEFLPSDRPLPVGGWGALEAHATGTLQEVALELVGQTDIYLAQQPTEKLRVQLRGHGEATGGELTLAATPLADTTGESAAGSSKGAQTTRLGKLHLSWEHPATTTEKLLASPQAVLESTAVQGTLELARIKPQALKPWVQLPERLEPLTLSGSGEFSYEQATGPSVDLTLKADLPRPPVKPVTTEQDDDERALAEDALAANCSNAALNTRWHLQLANKQLTLDGQLTSSGSKRMQLQASGALASAAEAAPLSGLRYRLDIPGMPLEDIPEVCTQVAGQVELYSDGRDLFGSQPTLTANLRTRGLHNLYYREGTDVSLWGELTSQRLAVSGQVLHGPKQRTLSPFRGVLPVEFGGGRFAIRKEAPISAQLHLAGLRPTLGPAGPISQVGGKVWAHVQVSGTASDPHVEGHAYLDDVAFTASKLSQPFHGIQGEVRLQGRKLEIPELSVRDLDGRLRIKGSAELPTSEDPHTRGDFYLRAQSFPIRSQGQVAAEANLKANIDLDLGPVNSEAQVRFRDADIWLFDTELRRGISMSPHPDIVDPEMPEPLEPLLEPEEDPGTFEIVLRSVDSFWVKRDDFAVNLSTDVKATVRDGNASATGEIEIHRGYLQLVGQTFDLEPRSKIRFLGGQTINPALEITATATGKQQGNAVPVTVLITGRAQSPEVQFSLDGAEASVGDVMNALLGPNRSNGSDQQESTLSSQAGRFVGGMLAGMLALSARRELGAAAPILMVDTGDNGDTQIRAGFDLESLIPKFMRPIVQGLYVEGIVGENSQDQSVDTGVLLELFFPYQLVGSGQYGPGNTWAIDLAWDP